MACFFGQTRSKPCLDDLGLRIQGVRFRVDGLGFRVCFHQLSSFERRLVVFDKRVLELLTPKIRTL